MMIAPLNNDIESAKAFLRNEALRKTVPAMPLLPVVLLAFFLGDGLGFLSIIPIAWMYFLQRSYNVIYLNELAPGFQTRYRILLLLITTLCLGALVNLIFFILMVISMLVYGIYFDSIFDELQKKYGVAPDELSKH